MRAQLVSFNPVAKGLVNMALFALIAAAYLAVLFGLGEESLPAPLQPQTDYFLFEEMPAHIAATFSGVALAAAAAAGFAYGVVSAFLYRVISAITGGYTVTVRPLSAASARLTDQPAE
ncbi:MAG: hypothetical protein AAGM38_11355 [Pseudomonadota bacterium]